MVAGRGYQAAGAAGPDPERDLLQHRLFRHHQRERRRFWQRGMAQVTSFSGGVQPDNFPSLGFLYSNYGTPYAILDLRRYNRGRLKQDGIDFNAQYQRQTGFGSISLSFGGTYTLHRKSSPSSNGVYTELLDNGVGRFNFTAAAGATVGPVTGRVQLTHSGGYPIMFDATQTSVKAFDTV
ncbi:hypothetical protein E4T56_gene8756, partial [Termitomyces sp. T112]